MKLNSFPLAISIFILLFGGIGITSAMNWWQTESTKIPAKYTEGNAAGQYNPADIRGSYTFAAINISFGIPLEDLRIAFRLPAGGDTAAFQVKSLETLYPNLPVEMGTASVRLFTAFYKGLPIDLAANGDTYLFTEAAEILKTNGSMLPEQIAFLPGHTLTVDLQKPENLSPAGNSTPSAPTESTVQVSDGSNSPTVSPTVHISPIGSITGKTTFQELLDWGVSPETITNVLGYQIPDPGLIIKDSVTSKGFDFSSMKTKLQAEVDKLK
jgi:hypothetical protein